MLTYSLALFVNIDYASTSLFQEKIFYPLCVHTWMLLVLAIFDSVYLMCMLTSVSS